MSELNVYNDVFVPQSQLTIGDFLETHKGIDPESINLVITSPPYNIRKDYEKKTFESFEEYIVFINESIRIVCEKITKNGAVCWQSGSYIANGRLVPLDYVAYEAFSRMGFKLRNRIIWTFNFGHHSSKRLSGRYETLLWFTKSDQYKFNLNEIRVPQIYPGKRHSSKHSLAGQPSGNPLGKNPGDVWVFDGKKFFEDEAIWSLPNLKSNHPEKTEHPCQFPLELAERCILAFSDIGDSVMDPFAGAGTTIVAAESLRRYGIGFEKFPDYAPIVERRLRQLRSGDLPKRRAGQSSYEPNPKSRVATRPIEWEA